MILPQHVGFRIVQLDLNRECKDYAISPIRYVNWVFAQRIKHLRKEIGCKR